MSVRYDPRPSESGGGNEKTNFFVYFLGSALFVRRMCHAKAHRKYVSDGLLVTGLNREAFLLEWGPPERTRTMTGEEIMQAGWGIGVGGGKGFFFKGKQTYDLWVYEKKGVELVFLGLRLIAWKTEKSVEELKTLKPPGKPKPKTLDEYTKEKKSSP